MNGDINASISSGSYNGITGTSGVTVTAAVIGNSLVLTGSGNVLVSIKNIDTIICNGRSTLNSPGVINAGRLVLVCNGTNSFSMSNLNVTDSLITLCNGTGTYTFSGIAKILNVKANAPGKFSGYGLTCTSCDVAVNGSGHSEVYVTTSLTGIVKGNGNVYYKGNPIAVFPVYLSGSGQFIKAD